MLKMLENKLLVKRSAEDRITAGGIILLDGDVKEEGTIITMGTVAESFEGYVPSAGDRILFERFSGRDFEYGGEMLLELDIKEVMGVFDA